MSAKYVGSLSLGHYNNSVKYWCAQEWTYLLYRRTLTHLDAIEDFIDDLGPQVFLNHLLRLYPLRPRHQAGIERNHQHQDRKSSKDGRPHGEVEEDQREDDLKRS